MARGKHARRAIKGSTVIIAFMYATWVGYILFQAHFYAQTLSFLPSEMTVATAALFIGETVALARLKMAKEGTPLKAKQNQWLTRLGIAESDIEQDALNTSAQNEEGKYHG